MTTIQQEISEKLVRFEELVSGGDYELNAHYPHKADATLEGLFESVSQLDQQECAGIRAQVSRTLAERLLAFVRRSAVRALRENSEQQILEGMTASTLDDDLLDIRDVFRAWVLLFDACAKLDLQFDGLFEKAIRSATVARKRQLKNQFLAGPSYTKSIKAMKFTYAEDENGPIYIDQLFDWP